MANEPKQKVRTSKSKKTEPKAQSARPKPTNNVDAVRKEQQLLWLRKLDNCQAVHIHLTANLETLAKRFALRSDLLDRNIKYAEAKLNNTERTVGLLDKIADLVITSDSHQADAIAGRIVNYVEKRFGVNLSGVGNTV